MFIIIYILVSSILENEFIVKRKGDMEKDKIRSGFLVWQVPLVIFLNILVLMVYLFEENNGFFEKYFWDSPVLIPFLLVILFLFSYNSLYGLLFDNYMLKNKENINLGLVLLPLWTFVLSGFFVFIIMLLSLSINPIQWFLTTKDFFKL